jgi:hypothetical protein
MVDLVVTAASVVKGSGAKVWRGVFGGTVTAGQSVYRDATTKYFLAADNDAASAAGLDDTDVGVALNGGGANQPCEVQYDGEINLGATLTVGESYAISSTAGGICPVSDLASGDYPVILGVARTAALLVMGIVAGGAAKP